MNSTTCRLAGKVILLSILDVVVVFVRQQEGASRYE